MRYLTALTSALLCTALAAQRVVVIDANNGAGTDHTTLSAAFAALLDGDILIVRAGTYAGVQVSTTHDFVMIGEGNPLVQPPAPFTPEAMRITLSGTYQQRVAIRGMHFQSDETGQWALDVRTPYGQWPAPILQLEDCQVLSASPQTNRVALIAENVGLTVQRCELNTTQVIDSLVTFVESTITGIDQSDYNGFNQTAEVALDVIRSQVWIVDSTLRAGSSNGVNGSPASCLGTSDSSVTTYSKVHIAGDSLLQADQQPAVGWPLPYVLINYVDFYPAHAHIDYEPSVVMLTSPAGVLASAGLVLSQQTVPSLVASAATLGGAWNCTAHGDPGDLAIQLISTNSYSQLVLGLPTLMDVTTALITSFGAIDGTGHCAFAPIGIPNNLALRQVGLQSTAVVLTAAGSLLGTNPATAQIH